ncbi:MAG: FecR domain-containing protein [Rhodocyclaceae bacterium]|nr:FecR domain-containing protein [Rhodocyclaceae bacterium]
MPTGDEWPAAGVGGTPPVERALDDHRAALQAHFPIPPARAGRKRTAGQAGGALAVALLAGLWWADPAWRSETHATRVGQREVVRLADGSELTLDTATRLTVAWHLRTRRVGLEQGRAQFSVSPSAWRPFEVAAGSARVRVVGTRFDVWRKPGITEVSVYEGRVAVWRDGGADDARILLQAGQRAGVPADAGGGAGQGGPSVGGFDTERGAAWQKGELVFQNTPLREAAAEIQRYRGQAIRIHGQHVAALQVSGVFASDNTEQLLDLLPGILPVAVERKADGSVDILAR